MSVDEEGTEREFREELTLKSGKVFRIPKVMPPNLGKPFNPVNCFKQIDVDPNALRTIPPKYLDRKRLLDLVEKLEQRKSPKMYVIAGPDGRLLGGDYYAAYACWKGLPVDVHIMQKNSGLPGEGIPPGEMPIR